MKDLTRHQKVLPKIRPFVPNHNVISTAYGQYFTSYESTVVFKPNDSRITYLGLGWDYSRTTVKYVCQYLNMTPAELRKGLESDDFEIMRSL